MFSEEETSQIRSMQLDAPEFTAHYPKHREWLEKALAEILDGTRVAFGIRTGEYDSNSKNAKRYVSTKPRQYCSVN